jgi:hypothetical protein
MYLFIGRRGERHGSKAYGFSLDVLCGTVIGVRQRTRCTNNYPNIIVDNDASANFNNHFDPYDNAFTNDNTGPGGNPTIYRVCFDCPRVL